MADSSHRPFETILRAHAPQPLRSSPSAVDLETLLQERVARCHQAWPQFQIPILRFLQHLAERLHGASLPAALAAVHTEDLYLTCACAASEAAALAAFDELLLSRVPAFLTDQRPTPVQVDEVRQQLRERLLVATPGKSPRIADYSGRGALAGWVRIAAVRTMVNLRRNKDDQLAEKEQADPDQLLRVGGDPELAYLQQRYQGAFKAAVQEALAALSADHRTFLRLHLINGLKSEQIGALFHMSRSTAHRRIAEAREAVHARTRHLLQERLQLSPPELQSLARLMPSELGLSMARCLAEQKEEP